MLSNTRARVTAAVTVLALMLVPGVASATPAGVDDAINTAVQGAQSDVLGVLTSNVPLILAVTVGLVLLRFGKRIINMFR